MSETREQVILALEEFTRQLPEQRIGQIIYNYILTSCPNEDPFFLTDEQLLKILQEKAKDYNFE